MIKYHLERAKDPVYGIPFKSCGQHHFDKSNATIPADKFAALPIDHRCKKCQAKYEKIKTVL